MASPVVPILDGDFSDESDYGSDFSIGEEGIVNQLLQELGDTTKLPSKPTSPDSSSDHFASLVTIDVLDSLPQPLSSAAKEQQLHELHSPSRSEHVQPDKRKTSPTNNGQYSSDSITKSAACEPSSAPLGDVRYPDLGRTLSVSKPDAASASQPIEHPKDDESRSPLQRFRSFPKRPLTVSDLSSGAWCELQYWYTLTLLPGGQKTRTAAMRGGTRVHQTLEDQVHTTVQVDVTNKEEAFALRLWNVIQGLRTLRDTGMTRELEVWGIIEGQIVNGIIDELSHKSPNASFEEELSLSQQSQHSVSPGQQATIMDYLEPPRKRVYLADVKTRGSERLPTGAALRPARVQLFLYHRLLGEMASGVVDFAAILSRYGLKDTALFSDAFMAQVGELHDEIFYDAESDVGGSPSTSRSWIGHDAGSSSSSLDHSAQVSPPTDLIRYRSIAQILPLLQSELRETFPRGAASLGDLLAVQYRHRDDGRILGINSFPNDPEALQGYIERYLKWWRGERDAEGVSIEETYKCRSCEFAESCEWRKDKEAEFLRRKKTGS